MSRVWTCSADACALASRCASGAEQASSSCRVSKYLQPTNPPLSGARANNPLSSGRNVPARRRGCQQKMFWMSYESDLRRQIAHFYLPQALSASLSSSYSPDEEPLRPSDSVRAKAAVTGTQIPRQLLKGGSREYRGDDWGGPPVSLGGDWNDVSKDLPPFRIEAPGQRIVAIGDLHGDLEVTKEALRLAGVLSSSSSFEEEDLFWTGGNTMVVQLGDILDRGEDEIAILSLLRHLDSQARDQGGRVFQLNGNHETLNVSLEFRYVADGGFRECDHFIRFCEDECSGDYELAFRDWWRVSQRVKKSSKASSGWAVWNPLQMRKMVSARVELFNVGGPLALELSRHGVALMINDNLFAHGGVLPHHVEHGLDRMNLEVSRWMKRQLTVLGEPEPMPFIATRGYDSIVWSRLYSTEFYPSRDDRFLACAALKSTLDALGASRLVVGHTPQITGANSACHERVWRIDVGMSSGMMGAPAQVLEIHGDHVKVLGGTTEGRAQFARFG